MFRKSFAKNQFIILTNVFYNYKKYNNCVQFNSTLIHCKLPKRENKTDVLLCYFSVSIIVDAFVNPEKNG